MRLLVSYMVLSAVATVGIAYTAQVPEPVTIPIPLISNAFGGSLPAVQDGQMLIYRHMYIAAIDIKRKQPVWVSFTVDRKDWDTDNVLSRNFHTPKELQSYALEQSDYESSGFDLGHMYGLQFVSASTHAAEVNEVEVIAAQRPDLNRGVWLQAENRIKEASSSKPVKVITGLLWALDMPKLANADEYHEIASHCWVIMNPGPSGIEEAYLIPQSCEAVANVGEFSVSPDKLRAQVSKTWVQAL